LLELSHIKSLTGLSGTFLFCHWIIWKNKNKTIL
jgi:hypothetical protein